MPKFVLHRSATDNEQGELVKMILNFANVHFIDRQYTSKDWAEAKSNDLLFPYGKLPVLEVGDQVISGGFAIARYLAIEFELAGKDHFEMAQCDSIVYSFSDLLDRVIIIQKIKNQRQKEDAYNDFYGLLVPTTLDNTEKILARNNGGQSFFVGSRISWADLTLVHMYNIMGESIFEDSPLLIKLHERVNNMIQSKFSHTV